MERDYVRVQVQANEAHEREIKNLKAEVIDLQKKLEAVQVWIKAHSCYRGGPDE